MFISSDHKKSAIERLNWLLDTHEEIGVGSSVSRVLFDAAAWTVGVTHAGPMPEVGQRLVESVGLVWGRDCDSRASLSGGGSTVTLTGLNRIIEALEISTGKDSSALAY